MCYCFEYSGLGGFDAVGNLLCKGAFNRHFFNLESRFLKTFSLKRNAFKAIFSSVVKINVFKNTNMKR